ncbi:uncharacterized protein LOC111259660 [Varroa jacobsoni]|uniref:uncharacterized protein LOC111259660 n=1 Tax=Varroa jacobsoni TaxID=62625 RepID=UPI000BF472BE|nr:uncharacterized protein LOC111259660 [Varroa jacobsoni]
MVLDKMALIMKFVIFAILLISVVITRSKAVATDELEEPEQSTWYLPSWDQTMQLTRFLVDAMVKSSVQEQQNQEPVLDTGIPISLLPLQPQQEENVDDDLLKRSQNLVTQQNYLQLAPQQHQTAEQEEPVTLQQSTAQSATRQQVQPQTRSQSGFQPATQRPIVRKPVIRPTMTPALTLTTGPASALASMFVSWMFGSQQQEQLDPATNSALPANSVSDVLTNAARDPAVRSVAQKIIGDLASVYLRPQSSTPMKQAPVDDWGITDTSSGGHNESTEPADAAIPPTETKAGGWGSWFG